MDENEINVLVHEYLEKLKAIDFLAECIRATKESIQDPYIDYVTKREYQNDIIADERAMESLKKESNELLEFIRKNGLEHLLGFAEEEGKHKTR